MNGFRLYNKNIGYYENPAIYLNYKGELVAENENGRKRDLTKLHEASKKACTGLKRSIETRKKISESHKGLGAKSIKCIETGEIFSSIQEASNKYNVCHESIRRAVHNRTKSCGLHFIIN